MKGIPLLTWALLGGNLGFHRFVSAKYLSGILMLLCFIIGVILLILGLLLMLKDKSQAPFVWGLGLFLLNTIWTIWDIVAIWRGKWSAS